MIFVHAPLGITAKLRIQEMKAYTEILIPDCHLTPTLSSLFTQLGGTESSDRCTATT